MYPFLNCLVNGCASLLSPLSVMYRSSSFLAQTLSSIQLHNPTSIFTRILSLAFFLKTWIYLWNIRETNFLASDFTASFSSS